MIDEKEQIWSYVGKGFSYEQEYMGTQLGIKWTAYYLQKSGLRVEIGSGYTQNPHNYEEIISVWKQHARDLMITSILENKGIEPSGKIIFTK